MRKITTIPDSRRRIFLLGGLLLCGGAFAGRRVFAADNAMPMPMPMSGDEHMHHHHHQMADAAEATKRSEVAYQVPAVSMLRADGTKAAFPQELDDGRPVILNFIYTSCTAICPVTTQVFSQVQGKLGKDAVKVHMVSISIDPEYDTPARLSEYAKKYGAAKDWQFYTGTVEASIALQKAFDTYRGDKMNHIPVTYLRAAPGKPWVRLDGFAKPDEVVHEYHGAVHGS
jgi:protein SCO1/2